MNLNQLRLFYLAVKYKSVSRAADELSITQPAVSKGIQKLQEFYEVPLIIKPGKQMELTLAGNTLYKLAEKIFELDRLADDCMSDFQKDRRKHIKMSAS
jgi:DNA-binding transcriptional LysR family regulator